MNSHRLVVNQSLLDKDYDSTLHRPTEGMEQDRYRLFYQLTRVTRDRGALLADDRLDALAMAVGYWAKVMALDTDSEVEKVKKRAMEEELKRFVAHATGRKPAGRVWVKLPSH